MAMNEESNVFGGLEAGCPVHGDEAMRECTMCGVEFCRLCHPRTAVCPDCAESGGEDEEEEEEKKPGSDDIEDVEDEDDSAKDEEKEDADEDDRG
jgi:hypothetical protein